MQLFLSMAALPESSQVFSNSRFFAKKYICRVFSQSSSICCQAFLLSALRFRIAASNFVISLKCLIRGAAYIIKASNNNNNNNTKVFIVTD